MRLLEILPVAALALLAITYGAESDAARTEKSDSLLVAARKSGGPIAWQPWSEDAFARAQREKRFILLDLEAVWCHWCHVMDETTYRDPKVAAVIERHYIALKVDQDARPDLSRRYDEYGWPATVVFAANGTEIVKRRGYIPPERMVRLLEAIVTDPSPIKYLDQASVQSYSETPLLPEGVRKELRQRFVRSHDFKLGGMEQEQKFMDRDTVEYALIAGQKGDERAQRVARQDLDGALNLNDPVWGGAYQYSTDADWKHPHFEKLLSIQADYLRTYALAYTLLGEPAYLQAAVDIHRYVAGFLSSPEGAFYVSQDADLVRGEHSGLYFALDDAGRRKLGNPAIDRHLYAREQGWMVQALVQLYSATLDLRYLRQAIAAADWSVRNRSLSSGGFRHDQNDTGGPYLEDSVAMGRGLSVAHSRRADRAFYSQHIRLQSLGRLCHRGRARPDPQTQATDRREPGRRPLLQFARSLYRRCRLSQGRGASYALPGHARCGAAAPDRTRDPDRGHGARDRSRSSHDRRRQGRPFRASAVRLGTALSVGVSAHRVVGSARRSAPERGRAVSRVA
jgi:uncharacterized protein YyaL (SSP411 family)